MKNRKLKSLSLAVLTLVMSVFCFGIYGAGAEAVTEQHLFDECDVIDDSREAELNDILGKTAKDIPAKTISIRTTGLLILDSSGRIIKDHIVEKRTEPHFQTDASAL